jgi:hypothetical protein
MRKEREIRSGRKRTRHRWIGCATDTGELRVSPRLCSLFMRVLDACEDEAPCAHALFETIAELLPEAEFPPLNQPAACGRA